MLSGLTKTLSGSAGSHAKPQGSTAAHQSGLGRNRDPGDQDQPLHNTTPTSSIPEYDLQTEDQIFSAHPAVRPLDGKLQPRSPFMPSCLPPNLLARSRDSDSDEIAEKPSITESERLSAAVSQHTMNNHSTEKRIDRNGYILEGDPEVSVDYTVHHRLPVVHEEIKPHERVIYQPRRMRSFHFEEHRNFIQPIAAPDPTILPAQHWEMDSSTKTLRKI